MTDKSPDIEEKSTGQKHAETPIWLDMRHPLPYLLPMFAYMIFGMFEPTAPGKFGLPGEPGLFGFGYDQYPFVYAFKLLLTIGVLALCAPAWRQWKFRVSPLAIVVGVVGVVLWVAICRLDLEGKFIALIGEESPLMGILSITGFGPRSAFNPFEHFGYTTLCYAFIVIRLFGLAVIVPLFEELMLRGWLLRNVVSPQFWEVKFGELTTQAMIVGTAFPMLYHPEKVASLVWFSLITWLMIRTKNFWDCVAAHGVTNLLLGLYVIWFEAWELW